MSLKSYCEKERKFHLLREWNEEKNLPLTPETVAHSSQIPVWWRCEKGHVWCTQVRSRAMSATGCPKCREKQMAEQRARRLFAIHEELKEKRGDGV